MTWIIKPETSYLKKKSQISILNQSNIEGWNWKKNFNCTKGFKKTIKRIMIKIKKDQAIIFEIGERRKKKANRWQIIPSTPTCTAPQGRRHDDASNNMAERHFWKSRGATRAVRSVLVPPSASHTFFLLFF